MCQAAQTIDCMGISKMDTRVDDGILHSSIEFTLARDGVVQSPSDLAPLARLAFGPRPWAPRPCGRLARSGFPLTWGVLVGPCLGQQKPTLATPTLLPIRATANQPQPQANLTNLSLHRTSHGCDWLSCNADQLWVPNSRCPIVTSPTSVPHPPHALSTFGITATRSSRRS